MEAAAEAATSTNNPTLLLTQELDLIRKLLFSSSSHIRELVKQAGAFALVAFLRPILTLVNHSADVLWGIQLFKYVKYVVLLIYQ